MTVRASSVAEIGRSRKTIGSPREITIERRRFSSISGPRMKPSTSGAGSRPNLTRRKPNSANSAVTTTSVVLLLTV